MVLVDTTIWSLALRRRPQDLSPVEKQSVREWRRLVIGGEAVLVAPIRQEILSGIRVSVAFEQIRSYLDQFTYLELSLAHYDSAASFFNTCRAGGVAGTGIDMLVCAAASHAGMPIFTSDQDFGRYAALLPIELHAPPADVN